MDTPGTVARLLRIDVLIKHYYAQIRRWTEQRMGEGLPVDSQEIRNNWRLIRDLEIEREKLQKELKADCTRVPEIDADPEARRTIEELTKLNGEGYGE